MGNVGGLSAMIYWKFNVGAHVDAVGATGKKLGTNLPPESPTLHFPSLIYTHKIKLVRQRSASSSYFLALYPCHRLKSQVPSSISCPPNLPILPCDL